MSFIETFFLSSSLFFTFSSPSAAGHISFPFFFSGFFFYFSANVSLYPRSIPPFRRRDPPRNPFLHFKEGEKEPPRQYPLALVSYPAGSFGFLLVASPRCPVWILTVRINDPGDSNEISTPTEVCLINGIPSIVIANSDKRKLRHVFNALSLPQKDFAFFLRNYYILCSIYL